MDISFCSLLPGSYYVADVHHLVLWMVMVMPWVLNLRPSQTIFCEGELALCSASVRPRWLELPVAC